MNFKKWIQNIAILCSISLIIACFIPWVHNNTIDVTYTGFNVKKFANGGTLGRAGIFITILTAINLLFTLVPKITLKRINMFVCALLVAYTLRTYVIFTASLFEGEITKLAGIYLIIILSFILVGCSIFPNLKEDTGKEN